MAGSGTLSGLGINAPTAIAIDTSGELWVLNSGNASITRLFGAEATPTIPIASAVTNNLQGSRP